MQWKVVDFMMHRGPGMFGGWLWGVILVGVVVYFIIKYIDENKASSNVLNRKNNAIDLLDERYAKGEIDEDEYNRRKRVLKD